MPRTRFDRATIITFNEEQDHALVWSCSALFLKHMKRRGFEPYKTDLAADGTLSCLYRVPKKLISVRA